MSKLDKYTFVYSSDGHVFYDHVEIEDVSAFGKIQLLKQIIKDFRREDKKVSYVFYGHIFPVDIGT